MAFPPAAPGGERRGEEAAAQDKGSPAIHALFLTDASMISVTSAPLFFSSRMARAASASATGRGSTTRKTWATGPHVERGPVRASGPVLRD